MKKYIEKAKDGRTRLVIKYDDGHMTTKSYPRVLMEEKIGRPLKSNEDVHHKDGDKTNNDINNLEIIEHGTHQKLHMPIKYRDTIQICEYCGKEFIYTAEQMKRYQSDLRRNNKHSNRFITCSKECAGKMSSISRMTNLGKELEPLYFND